MKTILVPIDFSECSLNALRVAAKIVKKTNGIIYIVLVYNKPISGLTLQFEIDLKKDRKIRARIDEEIQKLADMSFLKGVKLKRFVFVDMEIWEMLNDDRVKDADLIVMGTHGSSGLNEFFIGSNSEKVVRTSNKPVLCVKHRNDQYTFKNIVFASDFSAEAEKAFPVVEKFAKIFGSTIHLLKINTLETFETTRESKKGIEAFLQRSNSTDLPIAVYNDSKKEAGITHYAHDVNAHLIVLGTEGRSGLSRFFNPSIAEGLVNHSFLPVLTINLAKASKTKT